MDPQRLNCLAFECLNACVPALLPVQKPGFMGISLVDCLCACVRVCAVQRVKGWRVDELWLRAQRRAHAETQRHPLTHLHLSFSHKQTDGLLASFAELTTSHSSATGHAGVLSTQCERLVNEKAKVGGCRRCERCCRCSLLRHRLRLLHRHRRGAAKTSPQALFLAPTDPHITHPLSKLDDFAAAVQTKLSFFDSLDEVSSSFAKASQQATATGSPEAFLPIMRSLDEATEYVRTHSHWKDAALYAVKFRQLQSRALGLVRSHVSSSLKVAAQKAMVAASAPAAEGGAAAGGAQDDMARLYVRFRAAAPTLAPLTSELARRAAAARASPTVAGEENAYEQLLTDCHAVYCERRLELVADAVHRRVRELAGEGGAVHLARGGCLFFGLVGWLVDE